MLAIVLGTWLSVSSAQASPDQPPGFRAPAGTVAYKQNLCKTKDGHAAFGLMRLRVKADGNGCARPLKAWVYNEKADHWKSVSRQTVKCCAENR